ncbi:MAG TPA: cytochrome c [Candidatus Acidoferrales bacterium]|nr:cytochrome c [Candidatus Acidoferrales bacterium]
MKTAGIIISVLVIESAILIVFVHSGLYNVAATSPDPKVIRWIFSRTSDNSVEHHAKGIAVPPLADSSMIQEGFRHYDEMCVECHGAPGVERSEIGRGLYPHGPNLAHSAKELQPAELFWVIKNGIRSTGMPAFGPTHSDEKIWAMVGFLEKMKDMNPLEYAAMMKAAPSGKGGDMEDVDMGFHRRK